MQKITNSPIDNRFELHNQVPIQKWAYYRGHRPRILLSREYVHDAIKRTGLPRARVVEIGCNALDISGHFSGEADVTGYDFRPDAALVIAPRYPKAKVVITDVELMEPVPCDVLVLCEILEHLVNPISLAHRLMPNARYTVISHPMQERLRSGNHEHLWSYSDWDFFSWFLSNGYRVLRSETFWCKHVRMQIALGERV